MFNKKKKMKQKDAYKIMMRRARRLRREQRRHRQNQ